MRKREFFCYPIYMLDDTQLEKLLQKAGKIDEKATALAREYATKNKVTFREALIKNELAGDEDIGKIEADFFQVPFVVVTKMNVTPNLIKIIPESVAEKQEAVVFERSDVGIKIALADVSNTKIAQSVAKKTDLPVSLYYATRQDIKNVIAMYRQDLQKKFEKLLTEGLGSTDQSRTNDAPIAKIVTLLITTAYEQKASDIHIEPRESEALVRFRIDGILLESLRVPIKLHDRIVTRIKVLSNLRTDEHLSAQDGKMELSLKEENLDLRVSILPISDGEKVVLRLLSSKSRSYSLADLGMNEKDLAKLRAAFTKPNGMILSTGPTGSGKTTTIYSILKIINSQDKNVTTIEDPIEYKIAGANQIQVNTKTNLTFANGLRSILRQDPDYIFVGEIRDNETAGIAVNAALTGHLVFSTLHTNDAPSAIPRLIDMKVEPFLIASTVNVVLGQRLVRKICDQCRYSLTMTKKELLAYFSAEDVDKHYIPVGAKSEVRIYKGKGCPICHFSGYNGRLGIYEVFEVTNPIRELIAQKKDAKVIAIQARSEGMTTMLDDGLDKITKGVTTIEEVLRVTKVED